MASYRGVAGMKKERNRRGMSIIDDIQPHAIFFERIVGSGGGEETKIKKTRNPLTGAESHRGESEGMKCFYSTARRKYTGGGNCFKTKA